MFGTGQLIRLIQERLNEYMENNPISIKRRLFELSIDYLVILGYLCFLLLGTVLFYQFILEEIPKLTSIQTQIISTITSVIPIILMFTFFDYYLQFGSLGKKAANLKLFYYTNKRFKASLLRNIIKFSPWQLAHMGVIQGIYDNFTSFYAILLSFLGLLLALFLIMMGLFRKDKRHIGDLLARTQVILAK